MGKNELSVGMQRVREAINDTLSQPSHWSTRKYLSNDSVRIYLSDEEWRTIEARIIEARPGEDEICEALTELGTKRFGEEGHHIVLFGDGSGRVQAGALANYKRLASFGGHTNRNAVAAIRSIILPPEQTLEEDFKTLSNYLLLNNQDTEDACDALANLREAFNKQENGVKK